MVLPDPTTPRSPAGIDLVREIARRAPTPGVHASGHPGLSLLRQHERTRRAPLVYEPCICVVAQGRKLAHLASEVYRYDALQYLVLSVPLSLECEIVDAGPVRPYLGLKLDVDPPRLSALLAEMEDDAPLADDGRGIDVSPTTPELCDALVRLLRAQDDPASARVLSEMVEREVLFRVLRGAQGAVLRRAARRDGPTHRIAQVLRHVQTHYDAPLEVAALARMASMSPSAFHRHFRELTTDSPLQYLKKMRLHHARRLMLHDGLGAAEASFRVGYQSPSQFSREFKRLFGETPAREVERARVGSMP